MSPAGMTLPCTFGGYRQTVTLALACLFSWYLGSLLAQLVTTDLEPATAVSVPNSPKCARQSICPEGTLAFRIVSGGGRVKAPYICVEDDLIIGAARSNYRRGLNVAAVNASSGMALGVRSFDMWEGDHSQALVKFLQEIPPGSLVLMATYDEGSAKLQRDAKEEIKKLGSNLIDQISFRSSWVLLGTKGVAVPEHLTREMMVHKTRETDVYNGWPHETEIEGCIETYRS